MDTNLDTQIETQPLDSAIETTDTEPAIEAASEPEAAAAVTTPAPASKKKPVMELVDIKQYHTQSDGSRVYGWQVISVFEALKLQEPVMRCPECKGAVRLYRASEDGKLPARAEHRKKNPGCSLGDCFDGTHKLATTPISPNE